MIIGIGSDLASIARISAILAEHGTRFIDRCFAESERVKAATFADPAPYYARRWAAKEAVAKALGLGIRDGIYLKDIVILNDAMGKPAVELYGGAKERLTAMTPERKTAYIHVSLSDDAGFALAFIVISAEQP